MITPKHSPEAEKKTRAKTKRKPMHAAWSSAIGYQAPAGSRIDYRPKLVKPPMLTPSYGDNDREIWHMCSMNPCHPRHRLFFFWPNTYFCTFWDIWVLRDQAFPAISFLIANGLAGIHRTRVQSRYFSATRRGLLEFCAQNMVICVIALC